MTAFLGLFYALPIWLQNDATVTKYHDITVSYTDCNSPPPPQYSVAVVLNVWWPPCFIPDCTYVPSKHFFTHPLTHFKMKFKTARIATSGTKRGKMNWAFKPTHSGSFKWCDLTKLFSFLIFKLFATCSAAWTQVGHGMMSGYTAQAIPSIRADKDIGFILGEQELNWISKSLRTHSQPFLLMCKNFGLSAYLVNVLSIFQVVSSPWQPFVRLPFHPLCVPCWAEGEQWW